MHPVLIVLGAATAAALASAAGMLPLVGRDRVPQAWLGWANAAAAGTMLGSAYLLAAVGIRGGLGHGGVGSLPPAGTPLSLGAGALLGIAFVWWTHHVSGTEDLDLNRQDAAPAGYGADVLLVSALHSATEGVAIGAAMAADVQFGIWVAVAIALHNVPEATVLAAVVRARGAGAGRILLLVLVSDAPMVPLAVSTFAIVEAAPALTSAVLGFGSGALIYLVTVDLLPESYRQTGARSIALVALVAMGMVMALQELLV